MRANLIYDRQSRRWLSPAFLMLCFMVVTGLSKPVLAQRPQKLPSAEKGRETIVFDFRAKPGFKPKTREENLISKLVGVVWIDPLDKQVIRLEARLAEGFRIAGGLLVSLRPGAALVWEQTRVKEGIWMPRFVQINLSVKVMLFGGGDINQTVEWSDYKHFQAMWTVTSSACPIRKRPQSRNLTDWIVCVGELLSGVRHA